MLLRINDRASSVSYNNASSRCRDKPCRGTCGCAVDGVFRDDRYRIAVANLIAAADGNGYANTNVEIRGSSAANVEMTLSLWSHNSPAHNEAGIRSRVPMRQLRSARSGKC